MPFRHPLPTSRPAFGSASSLPLADGYGENAALLSDTVEVIWYLESRPTLEPDPKVEVRTGSSCADALEMLAQMTPDLMLLDMMMPVLDGPITFPAIRERFCKKPAVAFITDRTSPEDVERLVSSGANGIFPNASIRWN